MAKILEGFHLLIAEDNPTNQIVVAKMIEQLGGTFDLASDGVEAIQLFDPKKHHLALLDIEMPKKSGLEVIRYIRERADTAPNFPIVALTAFVLSDHRSKISDSGADAIIAKPIIDIEKFGEELAIHLNVDQARAYDENALMTLRANMGDDVMPELIKSLKADLRKIQGELLSINERGSLGEALRSQAHSLASLAKLSGATMLASQASDLEHRAVSMSDPQCIDSAQELASGIDDLLTFIDSQVNA